MGRKTVGFVLGLLGGIIGLISAFIALGLSGVGGAFGAEGAGEIAGLSISAFFASILGIVGACLVKSKSRLAGIFMIVSAIWGFISISAFYILAGPLLIIAGIISLTIKKNN